MCAQPLPSCPSQHLSGCFKRTRLLYIVPHPLRSITTNMSAMRSDGDIEFRVVNNDNERESLIILTGLKCLFQKQLPEMPKHYIARLVYDRSHISIAIVKKPLEVVGGISYRPVKGYGAHMMSHLKDYVRATSDVMHFLTYADNYAIGFFKKQGVTKDITLERSVWSGYIKDYEGGTIMHCSMLPRIRYLEVDRVVSLRALGVNYALLRDYS